MQLPLVPESTLAIAMHFKTPFEKALTLFAKYSLITTVALAAIGIIGKFALYFFEKEIDNIDSNPHGMVQKTFKITSDLCGICLQASFYIGSQAFVLSQIINFGHALAFGTSAIHYRHVFNLI